jgi:hypothetical protein
LQQAPCCVGAEQDGTTVGAVPERAAQQSNQDRGDPAGEKHHPDRCAATALPEHREDQRDRQQGIAEARKRLTEQVAPQGPYLQDRPHPAGAL